MSQEHIEIHRRALAAIDAGDFSDDLFSELCTPGFRMENTATAVTDKTYHGPDGVREWMSDLTDAFEPGARHQLDEIVADGEDFVVSVVEWTGRGARSGAPLVLRWVTVMWFENGKMARAAGYLNRRDALKAVGLAEHRGRRT